MRLCVPSLRLCSGAALRRGFASALGIILLVLQMLVPQTGQAAGGNWIEICSEYGAVEIQVDLDGIPLDSPPANDIECPECPTCALCALTGVVAIETAAIATGFDASVLTPDWYGRENCTPNPAQFWPDNRGPPLAKASTEHMGLRALALIPTKGEVPCS